MSSSTIIIKTPTPSHPDGTIMQRVHSDSSSTLLSFSLWLFSSIFSATKVDFSSNLTGISLTFNVQDVVLIGLSAWMLHRGLSRRSVAFVFPWLIVTLYGLYYNHYRGLVKMANVLKHFRHSTALPWIAIFFTSFGIVIRIILTLRILQLSANLWYRKKLEKELYEETG